MEKKPSLKRASLLTGIALVAEIFAVWIGVAALQTVYGSKESGEGLALIVLLPVFLIAAVVVLALSLFPMIKSGKMLGDDEQKRNAIVLFVLNVCMNMANIVMFLCVVMH